MNLSKSGLKEQLELARSTLSLVKVNNLEMNEMCMLLRANIDDVEYVINECTLDEVTLRKIDLLISNIVVGIEGVQG